MRNLKDTTLRSMRGSLAFLCCVLVIGAASSAGRLTTKAFKNAGEGDPIQSEPIAVSVRVGLKLEIVSVKQWPNDLVEVTMKNGFEKDITAIAASAAGKQSFRRDYVVAELEAFQKLAPGATDQFLYSLSRRFGVPPEIIVSAVVFSDGTSKGDKTLIADILDKREGIRIQLNRINPYLERLGKVKGPGVRAELGQVKSIAEALSCNATDGAPRSPEFEYGLRHGREYILSYLSKLETALENERVETVYDDGTPHTVRHSGEEAFRSYLPRIEEHFKRLSSRL